MVGGLVMGALDKL